MDYRVKALFDTTLGAMRMNINNDNLYDGSSIAVIEQLTAGLIRATRNSWWGGSNPQWMRTAQSIEAAWRDNPNNAMDHDLHHHVPARIHPDNVPTQPIDHRPSIFISTSSSRFYVEFVNNIAGVCFTFDPFTKELTNVSGALSEIGLLDEAFKQYPDEQWLRDLRSDLLEQILVCDDWDLEWS